MALPATVAAARSWSDFVAAVDALADTTAKGAAFEELVAHYLRTDPIYRTKLASVWRHNEISADLRTRLRLPGHDMGIDLVAETHAGEFWAVQAKYRADTAGTITFGELSTFSALAFHVCAGAFAYALVCTTTARITETLSGLANLGELTAEIWAALPAAFFESLSAPTATRSRSIAPRPPRLHQIHAVTRATTYFATPGQTRGKLIHPCGAGKSLTAYWIARALDVRRVLVAVPSLALVRQTLATWTEALADGRAADWLCVCSDAEIASDLDHEELVARVHELGLPCDTDPVELEKHLRAANTRAGLLVVLTTYQSSPVLAQAARAAETAFDFCVCDEAHKTTGTASSYYAHLLHDENLPLPRRLFMTATERRFASSRGEDIVSMDDPDLYGETIDLLTFKAAIAADPPILCDYRILTIGVRESETRALVEKNCWLDLGPKGLDEVTSLALASLIALRRATTQYGVRHTVSFHSGITRAARFRDLCNRLNEHVPDFAPVRAFHVSGNMGGAARARELDAFMDVEPSLATNARCLTEGVDVPGIDCVFFADPKGSVVDIVQASGRALRLAKGKRLGYILLPLVVPDDATPEDIAESSGFKFVLAVLRALAAHDERIVEWFRATARNQQPEVSNLADFALETVTENLDIDVRQFARNVTLACWSNLAKLAYRPYEEAVAFAAKNGLTTQTRWKACIQSKAAEWPADIPRTPDKAYAGQGWINWGTFCGTGNVSTRIKEFRPYTEARAWARALRLKSSAEWALFRNGQIPDKGTLPPDVPYCPNMSYARKGWVSWDDFLGVAWMPYHKARGFAHSLQLKGQQHWKAYAAGRRSDLPPLPEDIPRSPAAAYAKTGDWVSWGDWLGNGEISAAKRSYAPFETARTEVQSLGLASLQAWRAYAADKTRFPATLPARPDRYYVATGWKGWSDWLGCDVADPKPRVARDHTSKHRDFASAREFARTLRLGGSLNWPRYLRGEFPDRPPKPADIPASPRNVYRADWKGWGDWLGTGNIAPVARKFRSFADARKFAQTLGFRSSQQYRDWHRLHRPTDLPSNPAATYADEGFLDWPDFLQASAATGF